MKGIKLSQLIRVKRVAWLLGGLLIVVLFGWKIGYAEISSDFFGTALAFLFFSYLLQAQATRSLLEKKSFSLLSLMKLKLVADTYNKISYVTPFRGDTIFRKVMEKKQGPLEGTQILILDRAVSGLASFSATVIFLLWGFLLSLPLRPLLGIGIGILASLAFLKLIIAGGTKERGLYRQIQSLLTKIGLSFLFSESRKGRYEEADRALICLLGTDRSRFWWPLTFQIFARISLVLVIYWLGKGAFETFSLPQALLLAGILPLLSFWCPFLPNSLGLFEVSTAALMAIFYGSEGLVPGFLLAIIFRLTVLTGMAVGLILGGNPTKILFR